MFGISGGELFVLLIIAALVMGPKNVAQALHGLRYLLEMVRGWSAKLRTETSVDLSILGIDASDVEKIKNFNLSQYDPRQMVREAVQEEMNAWIAATSGAAKAGKVAATGAVSAMQQAAAPFPADVAAADRNRGADGVDSVVAPAEPESMGSARGHSAPQGSMDPGIVSTQGIAFAGSLAENVCADGPGGRATNEVRTPNYLARPAGDESRAGAGTMPSSKDDDGPLDLHTILNRPELGGSR